MAMLSMLWLRESMDLNRAKFVSSDNTLVVRSYIIKLNPVRDDTTAI